ncbi:hypothetical protein KKF91_12825 [Myxococcota bacterium]|nr:hypothetical protein [Myxococcota bacterium]MBU1431418.1 hypothetical protein [Myxococcota bacterium]MBU1897816.1 hypothetical protein [Myxococcota bacterium]
MRVDLLSMILIGLCARAAVAQEAPPPADDGLAPLELGYNFAEGRHKPSEWTFGWHGYARMAVLWEGGPFGERAPNLVDDDYYKSGFAYTRVNESSWAELALSAQRGGTRFVAGLFASEFSDWSKVTVEEQWGMATGFVEHIAKLNEDFALRLKVGMFWERMGYVEPYDTYLFGRTHTGGASLELKLFDIAEVAAGHGAHQKVSERGFAPLTWARLAIKPPRCFGEFCPRLGFYWLESHTEDGDYAFGTLKDAKGSLNLYGGDLWFGIHRFGTLYYALAMYTADTVKMVGNSFELLHSNGGTQLTNNFLGGEGTGELVAHHWRLNWQPHRTLSTVRALKRIDVDFFGLVIQSIGEGATDNPNTNRHDRVYMKWGTGLKYRLAMLKGAQPYLSYRFDRVILDADHESLSFRVHTPRLGVQLEEGFEVFASWSFYSYGDNIDELEMVKDLQGEVGDSAQPDETVFKLQAQVSW